MFELGIIILMFILQWLSIWAGVSKIDKKETAKRNAILKQTICTMGLPAVLGLIIGIIFFFTSADTWIAVGIYILLSILFAFVGNYIYQAFFVKSVPQKKALVHKNTNTNTAHKNNTSNKKKQHSNKKKRK